MNEEISRQLREAAEAHQPDRGRMLARVERGMAGATVRPRAPGIARSWPKVALAGVAAAGILATAGLAVAGIVQTAPAHPDSATSATVTSPSGTPSSTHSARTTDSPAPPPAQGQSDRTTDGRSTAGDPKSASPSDDQLSDGPLSSEGSIDPNSHVYWTQSRLTLTTTQPLAALTVELRIAQTGGVQTTGQWQTGPGDDFTITVQEIDGTLVHRWDLKPGRTVPAGQHAFAAQYNHPNGTRDAHADSYGAQATAPDGPHAVWGDFTPAG
ncbi:hypothetical protein [Saccharothrix deserti]|uniref:hypothetical protein n=1 Tax=Saccharothrix deserti TaxID=2593674 RepID=UPI00131B1505|nr:hypothetical protein [Saccharothrix deserti]